MEVQFDQARLADICSSSRKLSREFGPDCADRIAERLRQLTAAYTLADLIGAPGRCHELKGNRAGQLAIDAKHPKRIIFEPAPPAPLKADGGLDWGKVDSVIILEVVDYHG